MTPQADAPRRFEWPGGLTWLAHPDEPMQRASHALATDDGVWLVDPVAADSVDEAVEALGDVAGVVLLLDRHRRDAAAVADRHDVEVHLPAPLTPSGVGLDARVETFDGELAATGFRARPVVDNRFWREAALVGDGGSTALVPEALGTAAYYTAPGERVGIHPGLRLWPPRRRLADLDPERLLVGHGEPVLEDAGPPVRDALAGARRRAPAAYWGLVRSLVRG